MENENLQQQYRLVSVEQGYNEMFKSELALIEFIADGGVDLSDPELLILVGNKDAWISKSIYQIESAVESYKLEAEEEYTGWKSHTRSVNSNGQYI